MTKHLFTFVCALLLISGVAHGQTSSGSIMLGGDLGFSVQGGETESGPDGNTTTADKSTQTNFRIRPRVGYFVADNFAVGLDLQYQLDRSNDNQDPETITTRNTIGAGLFGRYYWMMGDGNFGLFGQAELGFSTSSGESETDGSTSDLPTSQSFAGGIRPGVTFFPTENFGIDFSVGLLNYSVTTTDNAPDNDDFVEEETDTNFQFNADFRNILANTGLGMHYYF
jgi:outer membrane protein